MIMAWQDTKPKPIRILADLTPRQREILRMIGEEETTEGIAQALDISSSTVEYHRMELMRRTGKYSQVGLAKLAIKLGLVTI